MIKKRSGAPPPRWPGAAVRASPAPRRPHSNSLRSRAATASPDPPARPAPGGGTPGPGCPGCPAAPAARPGPVRPSSCRPGPRPVSLCGAPRRPVPPPGLSPRRRRRRRTLPGGMVRGPSLGSQEVRRASPMSAPRCGLACGRGCCCCCAAGPRQAGR